MMEYDNDPRSEGYEEVPESLLRNQRRGFSPGRKLLLILLSGGGIVIFLVLLMSFFSGKSDRVPAGNTQKTLHLGSAQDLPEARGVSGRELPTRAAATDMTDMMDELKGQIAEDHEQVMEAIGALAAQMEKQAGDMAVLEQQIQEMAARSRSLETQIQKASKAMTEAKQASRPPEKKAAAAPAPQKASKKTYTVQENDTLYSIARKNNIGLQTLLKVNGLREDSVIHPGDKLVVSP